MKNILVLMVFLCAIMSSTYTQTTIKIIDIQTDKSVPYALAKIDGQYFYADENGQLTYPSVSGTIRLEAEQIGYDKTTVDVALDAKTPVLVRLSPRNIVLEEIIVSEGKREVIAQSEVIQDQAKMVSQPRDLGDLLKDQPGFGMVKRGGYALDPVFRSFKYEQLNLVYDGGMQAVHACPARMDPVSTHVSPAEIEKVELIRGPFSVRFGQTMGGVINLVTKPALGDAGWSGHAETGYETNGHGKVAQLGLKYGSSKFHYAITGGIKDFGNYANGEGQDIPSAFKTYDYSAKIGFRSNQNEHWQVSWRQAFARDILHAGLMMDSEEDNSSLLSVDYQVKNLSSSLFGLTVKAYGSRVDHLMTNERRPNFMMVEAVADVQSTTIGGKIEGSWLPSKSSTLYTGFDAKYIGRKGDRVRTIKRNMMTGEPLPTPMIATDDIWQDASLQNYGLFIEYRSFLNDSWALSTGARLDWVMARAGDPAQDFAALYDDLNTNDEINFSANASLTFSPTGKWNLQLAAGRGTRTANMIERYINHFTVGVDAYEYVGNPHLKPEANHQLELSFSTQTEAPFQLSANVFYSYITNFITAEIDEDLPRKFMPMAQPQFARRFVNIDAAGQTGGELQLSYQWIKWLKTYGSLSYTRAHNLDWDEPLAEIPPLETQLGARYESDLLWIDARYRMVAEQNRVSVQFGETATPGFGTLDLRAGIEPVDGLSLGLGVLNVFDVNYYEHLNRTFRNMSESSIIYEPGRNATVFLKYLF